MKAEIEKLFHELVDLSLEARERFFAEHPFDRQIRQEVEQLLAFEPGASEILMHDIRIAASHSLPQLDLADIRCGAYRLLKPIGQGGMGTVYLAERVDGEVGQRAAIKFLNFGEDTPVFRQRFLQERQILATLTHSGIARLLDAGHTADGRPYLAMEYIEGKSIDIFADTLDLRAKLMLFVKVCAAVSYAHRNLIIHRDLKPSNILVDHSVEPKLLDFGIAKILDSAVERTQTQERLLTPEYASPEQIRGAAQTTATDIYSLGAVLYKLLTGKSPHASETREGMLLAISNTDPVPPSRIRSVPRDLDFVVGTALRKEPEERYPSVDALAGDIAAFLDSCPVRARSGDIWYRARKFARRYWVPIAAVTAVVASLAAGLYIANRERLMAERRFAQVRHLANRVLALDKAVRSLPGSTQAREDIVAISEEYLEGLAKEAGGNRELAAELSEAYFRLALAQGLPNGPNLGHYADAEDSLKKGELLLDSILKAPPLSRNALLTAADIAEGRMILASTDGRREDALAQGRKAAARLEELFKLGNLQPLEADDAGRIFVNIALMHKNSHLYQDSIHYARRALEIVRPSSAYEELAGNGLSIIADSLRYSGDLEGALASIREARSHIERANFYGETMRRSSLFSVLWREGVILGGEEEINLQSPAEAMAVLKQAFDIVEKWAQEDLHDFRSRDLEGTAVRELGRLLSRRDPQAALALYDKGLLREREISGNRAARREEARILAYSSYPLRRLNRTDEAGKRIESAFALLRETKDYPADKIDPDHSAYAVLRSYGDHLADTGQVARAGEVYQELIAKSGSVNPLDDLRNATKISMLYQRLAEIDRKLGHPGDAAAMESRRRELWSNWAGKIPQNKFVLDQLSSIPAEKFSQPR